MKSFKIIFVLLSLLAWFPVQAQIRSSLRIGDHPGRAISPSPAAALRTTNGSVIMFYALENGAYAVNETGKKGSVALTDRIRNLGDPQKIFVALAPRGSRIPRAIEAMSASYMTALREPADRRATTIPINAPLEPDEVQMLRNYGLEVPSVSTPQRTMALMQNCPWADWFWNAFGSANKLYSACVGGTTSYVGVAKLKGANGWFASGMEYPAGGYTVVHSMVMRVVRFGSIKNHVANCVLTTDQDYCQWNFNASGTPIKVTLYSTVNVSNGGTYDHAVATSL